MLRLDAPPRAVRDLELSREVQELQSFLQEEVPSLKFQVQARDQALEQRGQSSSVQESRWARRA
jgi:hypothetical protein